MKLSEFIINDIKPLKISSKSGDLQELFNQLTFSHIPIRDENNRYIGCFSEADAYTFENNKPLTEYKYALEGFFVNENMIWLDVLEAFATNSTNIIPILNEQNKYLGYYELNDIMNLFSESPFLSEHGGILIIEKELNDYSFSEISQIIESNNGKLLGAFISSTSSNLIQITLKISSTDLNTIIQTFRRYSYNIISGHDDDSYIENLKERSDYLKRYLNI